MKLESVKLEKQVTLQGQESKCYSVEPVLRCLPGCMSVRTTPVRVGYHCVSAGASEPQSLNKTELHGLFPDSNGFTLSPAADSNVNRAEGLTNIFEKSVDLIEKAEAHVACRCTAQCA